MPRTNERLWHVNQGSGVGMGATDGAVRASSLQGVPDVEQDCENEGDRLRKLCPL